MKKSLICSLIIGMSSVACATTYTLTPDYASGTRYSSGTLVGFADTLDGSGMTVTGGDSSPKNLYLTSVSLASSTSSTVKLAVYEDASSTSGSSVTTSLTKLVGISEASRYEDGTLIFTFTDALNLSASQNYAFLFVTSATTAEDLNGTNLSTAYLSHDSGITAPFYTGITDTTSSAAYTVNKQGALEHHNDWHASSVTYVVSDTAPSSNLPVPEPATATLSLLAVVGLAVRRRRK